MIKFSALAVGEMQSNTYIVYNDSSEECVVIDAGGDYSQVLAKVSELGKQITALLLTHGHVDHIAAAEEYRRGGAIVGISAQDAYMLKGHRDNLAEYVGVDLPPVTPDFTFGGGDKLALAGMEFTVISTPGHTAGSCCFLCDNVCFSGDTLFLESVGRTDFPTGDHAKLMHSLKEKLFTLSEGTIVCPGHEGQTSIGYEKKFNPYA